jgi:rhodanese-related sulfurtransferase
MPSAIPRILVLAAVLACGREASAPRPVSSSREAAGQLTAAEGPARDSVAGALEAELARYPERYASEPFPLVSVPEVKEMLDRHADLVVVDARDSVSYARGHLPGAVNVPFGNWLEEGRLLPPKDRDLIVYCNNRDCPIARLWSEKAVQYGYTRVRHMKAGFAGWREAGLPVETGTPAS